MHYLLFDKYLNTCHSSQESYGRLMMSADIAGSCKGSVPGYGLLVDQCAAEFCNAREGDESSSGETTILTAYTHY